MSSYEDYGRVSQSYDQTRRPVGLALVRAGLERCGTPFQALKLLDAGCGTGAYTAALADDVPHIIALDFNTGMLGAARAKRRTPGTQFLRASIQAMPIRNDAADGVLNNLVLHHLPNDDNFAAQRQTFAEFARVLRPGGALVIGVCTREQLRDGFWFNRLIPQAIDTCCDKTAPLDLQIEWLEAAGFAVDAPAVPWNDVLQGDAYFDRLGPLDPAWRDGDSVWSLAPPQELRAACQRVQDLEEAGSLDSWVTDHEPQRLRTGQITYIRAIRR